MARYERVTYSIEEFPYFIISQLEHSFESMIKSEEWVTSEVVHTMSAFIDPALGTPEPHLCINTESPANSGQ